MNNLGAERGSSNSHGLFKARSSDWQKLEGRGVRRVCAPS
jgi:hypothetical protein